MNKIQQHISDQLRTMSECELVDLVEAIALACYDDFEYYQLTQPSAKIFRFKKIESILKRANFKPGESK